MIAREGIPFIVIALLLTLVSLWAATRYDNKWLFAGALIFGVLAIFIVFFFRDPHRTFTPAPELLISPADGKVIAIESGKNHEFIGGDYTKISIFLSVFDVHINRVPATGIIDYVKYNPGKFFAAFQEKASALNEQTEIGMTTTQGRKIMFKQIAGLIARRIVCTLKPGDTVVAGQRFGLIRFGSRTELFIPDNSELKIKIGDHVVGGQTIVGFLKLPAPADTAASLGSTRERL